MVAAAFCAAAVAAPKPAPKKPAPKAPTKRVVLGTSQFSGDNAVPGQEYTLNKGFPMNFRLDSAEYSTARLRLGQFDKIAAADEKYLIIHFTLHNPQPREAPANGNTFRFTAVDDTDTNREGFGYWAVESTKQDFNLRLKPGQKMSGYTFIAIPAAATVPKLIVKAQDNTVLRYDLKGKIKPLSGPAVDPAKPDRTGALAVAPAAIGDTVQVGDWDFRLESVEYSDKPLPGPKPQRGERYIVMTATVANGLQRTCPLRNDSFRVRATDQDGVDTALRLWTVRASSDVDGTGAAEPGKPLRVRIYAVVPASVAFKELTVTSGSNARSWR
jgi:hypothetical protein